MELLDVSQVLVSDEVMDFDWKTRASILTMMRKCRAFDQFSGLKKAEWY